MAKIMKNAGNLLPGDKFYVVVEHKLFPDSPITKAEVLATVVKNTGWGPNDNEDVRVLNGKHTVKVEGKVKPGVEDIVFDPEVAKEIWGESMENTIKEAEKQLETAKRDLEAAKNYRIVTEKTLLKEDLGFDKKGRLKEITETEEDLDINLKSSKSYKSTD